MRAIDTNVLVRLLIRDDERQTSAAEAFIEQGAWVSLLVLMEASWIIQSIYDVEKRGMQKFLDMLLQHEHLVIEQSDTVRSALLSYQSTRSVDFSDCLIAAVAEQSGHKPLGTFDKKFSKLDSVELL